MPPGAGTVTGIRVSIFELLLISDICQIKASYDRLNFAASNIHIVKSMKKPTILIADKDDLTRNLLEHQLNRLPYTFVLKTCTHGLEAEKIIHTHQPDLIFMEVELPGKNAFDIIEATEVAPAIVLMSWQQNYAARAFEYKVADYLLKPVESHRLDAVFERLSARNSSLFSQPATRSFPKKFFVEKGARLIGIPVSEIVYLKAEGDYTRIYTKDKQFYLSTTGIGQLEARLDPRHFLRVHRSYIVNISCIKELYRDLNRFWISLQNEVEISIGRSYLPVIRSMIL